MQVYFNRVIQNRSRPVDEVSLDGHIQPIPDSARHDRPPTEPGEGQPPPEFVVQDPPAGQEEQLDTGYYPSDLEGQYRVPTEVQNPDVSPGTSSHSDFLTSNHDEPQQASPRSLPLYRPTPRGQQAEAVDSDHSSL